MTFWIVLMRFADHVLKSYLFGDGVHFHGLHERPADQEDRALTRYGGEAG
jgi:hypothetical protein